MEKNTNILLIPFFCFIPQKHKKLVKESGAKLFLVVLLVLLIRVVLTNIAINSAIDSMCENIPQFILIHDELTIDKEILVNDDESYIKITSDMDSISENEFREFAYNTDYKMILIMTKTNMGIKSTNGISFASYKQLNIEAVFGRSFVNNDTIKEIIKPYLPIICVIYYLVLLAGFYIICLLLWLLVLIACAITHVQMPGKEQFKYTIIARMPIYIIAFICQLYLPFSIPWYVAGILTFIFMIIGLKLFDDSSYTNNTYIYSSHLTDDTDKYNNNF